MRLIEMLIDTRRRTLVRRLNRCVSAGGEREIRAHLASLENLAGKLRAAKTDPSGT